MISVLTNLSKKKLLAFVLLALCGQHALGMDTKWYQPKSKANIPGFLTEWPEINELESARRNRQPQSLVLQASRAFVAHNDSQGGSETSWKSRDEIRNFHGRLSPDLKGYACNVREFDHALGRKNYSFILKNLSERSSSVLNSQFLDEVCELVEPSFYNSNSAKTALLYSAGHGNIALAQRLLAHKVDVDSTDQKGWTPLMVASQNGHCAMCNMLLEKQAQTNKINGNDRSAFLIATKECNIDIISLFIQKGINVDEANNSGQTALMTAVGTNAEELKRYKIVNFLIENRANVNARRSDGGTPLHFVKDEDVARVLLQHGAFVNARDNDGHSPLYSAKDKGVIQALLEHGADKEEASADGLTLLYRSVKAACPGFRDFDEICGKIELLLQNGANPNVTAVDNGRPLLHYSIAKEAGSRECTNLLLRCNNCNVNIRDAAGRTALMQVFMTPKIDVDTAIMQSLLLHYADVNAVDNDGKSVIDHAVDKCMSVREDYQSEIKEAINILLSQKPILSYSTQIRLFNLNHPTISAWLGSAAAIAAASGGKKLYDFMMKRG